MIFCLDIIYYVILQDRQLAKNIFFLAKNLGKSRRFSHDEHIRVVSCCQLGRLSCQLLLERTTQGHHMVVTYDFGCRNMVVTDDFCCRNMVISYDFGCRNMVVTDDFGCRNMVVRHDFGGSNMVIPYDFGGSATQEGVTWS